MNIWYFMSFDTLSVVFKISLLLQITTTPSEITTILN